MSLLLHICCAPCSVACIESLRGEGIEPTGFWYNRNIQPYVEYRLRRDALKAYAELINMPLLLDDEYDIRGWVAALPSVYDRCGACYAERLERTAMRAAEGGFDAFSTTLLISPYQRHELIREIGEKCGEKYGVKFLYRDFRPLFEDGQKKAHELEFYMQKYCGCVFSEEERYRPKKFRREREAAEREAAANGEA